MGGSNESCHSLKKYQATFKQHYFRTSKFIFRYLRCGWKNPSTHITVWMFWWVFYSRVLPKECVFQILFSSYELFTAEKIPSNSQLKHPRNKNKVGLKKPVYFPSSTLFLYSLFYQFTNYYTRDRFMFVFQSFSSSISLFIICLKEMFQFL